MTFGWPRLSQLLALSALLLASLGSAATPQKPNWDRAWWAMNDRAFFRAYPSASWPDESWEATVPAARILRSTILARSIERNTKVQFRFGYENQYLLETIRFVVPGSFDPVEAILEQRLGLPIAGDRSEARCLEPDGSRKIEDPSGVGHVIASCLANATFVDRPHGNVIYLSTVYEWELAQYGSHSQLNEAQLVTIEPIETCPDCKNKP